MLKTKLDILGISCAIGFVTILLILGTATNGFINSASAHQQQFTAALTGSKGVPPINTPATGITIFTLSAGGKSLNYVLKVRNIQSSGNITGTPNEGNAAPPFFVFILTII
jgi:hypothetical protein